MLLGVNVMEPLILLLLFVGVIVYFQGITGNYPIWIAYPMIFVGAGLLTASLHYFMGLTLSL